MARRQAALNHCVSCRQEVDLIERALQYIALDAEAAGALVLLAEVQALPLPSHIVACCFEGVADFTIQLSARLADCADFGSVPAINDGHYCIDDFIHDLTAAVNLSTYCTHLCKALVCQGVNSVLMRINPRHSHGALFA